MKNRFRSIVALTAGAVIVLSGCAGGEDSSPGAAGEQESLTIWHAYAGQDDKVEFIEWAMEGFRAAHPDAIITDVPAEQSAYKTKLQTAISTGDTPDVFYTLPGGFLEAFVKSGQVAKLDSELDKDGWRDSLIASAMDSVTFGASSYAVPIDIDAAVVWYNKTLFAEKGWGIPTDWDGFLALAETIAQDGIVPVALGNKDSWPATFWYQYGVMRTQGSGVVSDILAGDTTVAFGESGVTASGMLQTLAEKNYLPTGANGISDGEANILFLNSQAAMVLNGTWQIGMAADAPDDFDLGYFPFPTVPGGAGDQSDVLAGVAAAFAISEKASANPLAIEFLRYLTSEEVMRKYVEIRKTMVTLKGATTADIAGPVLSGIVTDVIEPAGHLDPFYDTALAPKATTVYYSMLQGLIDGSVTPTDAAAEIDKAAHETE